MQANGVNYYKGVLLCSRPNQSPSVNRQKPFCGRVNVRENLGLVPTKQYQQHKTVKRTLPVLNNHKKWLEQFKKQLEQKKKKQDQEQRKRLEHLEKLRQEGRQRAKQSSTKQEFSALINEVKSQSPQKKPENKSVSKQNAPPANPHKKKAKPAWAQTQQQAEDNQQAQVDQLLDFFQQGDTEEVKDYLTDQEVKKVLSQLKGKIQSLKQQGESWKNKQMIKIQDSRKNTQSQQQDEKDDILSRISKHSGGQSVTSQKTVDRVEQLEKKKQAQRQWDKVTVSSKKSTNASVDQQIAKHIADQILRNYPNLKHHSNQSIRKLLQKQAKEQLKA